MSCYFESDSGTLWNPSSSTARLFIGYARVIEEVVGVSSGLGELIGDECYVDVARFDEFCQQVVSFLQRSKHAVLASLIRDFLIICCVLLKRAGRGLETAPLDDWDPLQWQNDLSAKESKMPS
jgi:Family of unknown function (DUF6086)